LRKQLRDICASVTVPAGGCLTFVTGRLPYGFAFPEVPSTHLFKYPDLGISIINGFSAEQANAAGVNVSVLVDPKKVDAPEMAVAAKALSSRGSLVRGYEGPAANVTAITDMVELFPYDLLLIATHCGDAPGYRWTYEFKDSEGIDRTLVVDIAIGVGHTDDKDIVQVTQFEYFRSLDDVDWHDTEKKKKLYVGTAMRDYSDRRRRIGDIEPVRRETIKRVVSSAALGMYDHNFIPLPRSLSNEGAPIIINNACASWHRLAETFTFSNARAYVGTLFPVSTSEAHDVIVEVLDKRYGKLLPTALWAAQRKVYSDDVRRPYVMTGVYPQRLRTTDRDVPRDILKGLVHGLSAWRNKRGGGDKERERAVQQRIAYYEREIQALIKRWPHLQRPPVKRTRVGKN
jgi:hypothetical protein